MVHYRGGQAAIDRDVYPDLEQFWSDLGDAYAEQVRRIGELGCTYLQFDDTSLAYLNDPAQRAMVARRGDDAEHLHLRYIQQINQALASRPPGWRSPPMCAAATSLLWAAEGGYDFVAEALFGGLGVDGFFLGTTTPLGRLSSRCASSPRDKLVVAAWSPPSGASWRTRTCSSGGSRTPAASCRWSSHTRLQCGFSSTVEEQPAHTTSRSPSSA